jgi:hypothetical protein
VLTAEGVSQGTGRGFDLTARRRGLTQHPADRFAHGGEVSPEGVRVEQGANHRAP